jgi:hypothetical protein
MTTLLLNEALVTKSISAFRAVETKHAALVAAADKSVQVVLDRLTLDYIGRDKTEVFKNGKGTLEIRTQLNKWFADALLVEGKSKATAALCVGSFKLAFERGVPFERALKNKMRDADKTKPQADGADTETAKPKSTKVVSVNRENLDAVLKQALAMSRALGLTEFAAEVLDICLDSLDGFKE